MAYWKFETPVFPSLLVSWIVLYLVWLLYKITQFLSELINHYFVLFSVRRLQFVFRQRPHAPESQLPNDADFAEKSRRRPRHSRRNNWQR